MTLENQVTSLELSKRLKELGFKQESLFYWIEQSDGIIVNRSLAMYKENGCDLKILWGKFTLYGDYEKYSAYTVAELGEMLPVGYYSGKCRFVDEYFCEPSDGRNHTTQAQNADTEADSRAKMLIYLKENNLTN